MPLFCSKLVVLTPSMRISAVALRLPLEIKLLATPPPMYPPETWWIPGLRLAKSKTPRPSRGRSLSQQGQIINEGAVQLLPGRTVLARKQRSGRHDFYGLVLGS